MRIVKSLALWLLELVALLATMAAFVCAFFTHATNDFGPILTAGICASGLALLCHAVVIAFRPKEAGLTSAIGVAVTVLALAEILRRMFSV